MNYNILRENDVRGEYPRDINENAVKQIGKAFGYYLNEKNINKCIIGHDNRLSSESLNNTLKNALVNSGLDVIDIGLVTTPMFNYASIVNNIPYGIMITASHNKASDNGLKIFGENFLHLSQDELKKLYSYVKEEKEVNGIGTVNELNIKDKYIKMLTNKFKKINKKVVVDCGNGTASIIVKELFNQIFLNVNYLNCESDGSFPIHNPDPNVPENLKWLIDMVKLRGADLGIAVDGDCDRVGIVDNKGNIITTDYLIAIFAKEIIPVNQNKKVLIDVKCSSVISDEIKKIGGKPIMVKNGSAYIEGLMHDTPALIGGEYSGHIFFRDDYYGYDDGFYAGLRFAKLLEKENVLAEELINDMKVLLSTPEIRIEVDDDKKRDVINKVKEYVIEKKYKAIYVDGVRVNYNDGFALIRMSNTGPYVTLRFEASNEEDLLLRKNEFMSLIEKFK